jgi:phosphoglucosamine mutase
MSQGRLFGTDGIRDVAGRGNLRPETVRRIGRALGSLVRDGTLHTVKDPLEARPVLIGRDTRESGPMIAEAISTGILGESIDVTDVGILTTPALASLVARGGGAAAVMISASHNPAEDNGIKIFDSKGEKLSDELEAEIESRVIDPARPGAEADTESPRGAFDVRTDLVEEYERSLIEEGFPDLDLRGARVVVDCANGAAYRIAPRILERLGASVRKIACEPNGRNINLGCGALHPEVVREEVLRAGAQLGLSLDGDGDRVILVDDEGKIRDGDDILLVLADRLHREGRLDGATVVATVMSNIGLELALESRGIRLVRTPVGDRHVALAMREGGYVLGGEQSGHILLRQRSGMFGDGLAAALAVLRVQRTADLPLSRLATGLERFPQILLNVRVEAKPPFESLHGVLRELQRVEGELGREGRVLLRYSGTEPLARVMVEGPDSERIRRMAEDLAAAIARETGATS